MLVRGPGAPWLSVRGLGASWLSVRSPGGSLWLLVKALGTLGPGRQLAVPGPRGCRLGALGAFGRGRQ